MKLSGENGSVYLCLRSVLSPTKPNYNVNSGWYPLFRGFDSASHPAHEGADRSLLENMPIPLKRKTHLIGNHKREQSPGVSLFALK